MRLALCLALVSGTMILAPAVEAHYPRLIVLGTSSAPSGWGLTEHAVLRVLGKPRTVRNTNYGGKPIRVARSNVHGGLFEVVYDRRSRRVVGLGTLSRYFRTADGLGQGSPISEVRAAGFRFPQCTANFERRIRGVLASFVAATPRVKSVSMIRAAYTSC